MNWAHSTETSKLAVSLNFPYPSQADPAQVTPSEQPCLLQVVLLSTSPGIPSSCGQESQVSLFFHAPCLSRTAVNLCYNSLIPETDETALFGAVGLPERRIFDARGLEGGARNPGFELDTRWEPHIPHLQNFPLSVVSPSQLSSDTKGHAQPDCRCTGHFPGASPPQQEDHGHLLLLGEFCWGDV